MFRKDDILFVQGFGGQQFKFIAYTVEDDYVIRGDNGVMIINKGIAMEFGGSDIFKDVLNTLITYESCDIGYIHMLIVQACSSYTFSAEQMELMRGEILRNIEEDGAGELSSDDLIGIVENAIKTARDAVKSKRVPATNDGIAQLIDENEENIKIICENVNYAESSFKSNLLRNITAAGLTTNEARVMLKTFTDYCLSIPEWYTVSATQIDECKKLCIDLIKNIREFKDEF